MGKKERKDKKEKPLDKMTIKELKEIAFTIPNVAGVHGMNKAELISIVKEHRGIVDERKDKGGETRELKKKLTLLKSARESIRQSGDKKKIEILRKKISRLKKKTRQVA